MVFVALRSKIRALAPDLSRLLPRLRRRPWSEDVVHAPGHRHRKPPPDQPKPESPESRRLANRPWIRTTHSDSQTRRFRR